MRILNFERFVLNEEVAPKPNTPATIGGQESTENKEIKFSFNGKDYDFTELYKKAGLI
jgi:hypothetical protein